MKRKVLLAGNGKKIISSFFMQMDSTFECMTSSIFYDDLKNHVEYFNPDIFVFCMRGEVREDIVTVVHFREILEKNHIPYAVIGDAVSLDFTCKLPHGTPDLSIKLPISSTDIEDTIMRYIDNNSRVALAEDTPAADFDLSIDSNSVFASLASLDATLEAMDMETRQPEAPDRPRILVIDDATIIHKTIKGHLDAQYEVATAISGKIALRYLKSKKVSLILLDYEMPEMNGPAVLSQLRESPYLAEIPVVFLTGINDVDKIKNALSMKPQGYLLKPVDKKALLDKIHELIG